MKKSLLIVILLLCFVTKVNGQNNSLSFDQLSDSIKEYLVSDPEESLVFSEILLAKGVLEDDNERIGQALRFSARAQFYLQNFKKAQVESKKYLRHAKSIDDKKMIVVSLILSSDISRLLSEIETSFELLEEALEVASEMEDNLMREGILSKLAGLYEFSGDSEKAIKMRKQTLEIFKSRETDSVYTDEIKYQTVANFYLVLASSYLKIENFDSSNYYNGLLKDIAVANDTCFLNYYYNIKAEIEILEERFSDAKKSLEKSLSYCPPDYDLFDLNMAFRFGKVEFGFKNYEEAVNILSEGLKSYTVTEAEEAYMDDYYKLLADSYKELGNFEQANFYFEKYINTQKKLGKLKGDIANSLNNQEALDFRKELDQIIKEKESENNILYYVVLASAVAVAILLLILLRFYKSKKRDELRFTNLVAEVNKKNRVIEKTSSDINDLEKIGLSEEVVTSILNGLTVLEEKEYFLSQDCTAYNVAKKIKTNTSYLSKVMNAKFNLNFNAYLNNLRVNYAIVRLKDDKAFRLYSIQGIAEELGSKSADSFTKYFKQKTGLNPSFYIKQLDNIS